MAFALQSAVQVLVFVALQDEPDCRIKHVRISRDQPVCFLGEGRKINSGTLVEAVCDNGLFFQSLS